MHVNILNRKTCKIQRLIFGKTELSSIQTVAMAVLADINRYALYVTADTAEDIELIFNNFNNVPIPCSPDVKRAVWTGDMAAFIILNYPKGNI